MYGQLSFTQVKPEAVSNKQPRQDGGFSEASENHAFHLPLKGKGRKPGAVSNNCIARAGQIRNALYPAAAASFRI